MVVGQVVELQIYGEVELLLTAIYMSRIDEG